MTTTISRRSSFLNKARITHGDKYDYSRVLYINSYTKVEIVCPVHGAFWQLPQHHSRGSGCPKCATVKNNSKKLLGVESFIKKSRDKHGDKYDYSKVAYTGAFNKVVIVCPIHGEFMQTPSDHGKGHGCPKCGRAASDACKHMTTTEFIQKANAIHGCKYNYSKTQYVDTTTDVVIACPAHGEFLQKPKNHLQGHGCPSCFVEVSHGHEELIDFMSRHVKSMSINNTDVISPLELDIYLPSRRLAIEFNGDYWHSYGRTESHQEKQKHKNKHLRCVDAGIRLMQIFEFEWHEKQDIVKSMLLNAIGKSHRIHARKCDVTYVDAASYRTFVNDNHLYGHKTNPSVMIGLVHDNALVSAISFSKHPKYTWEINRLVSVKNHVIVGGVSKMVKKFIDDYNPESILTYADARYGTGDVYRRLRFELVDHTRPNYKYIKRRSVFSRQQFQKHKLKYKLEDFDPDLTEAENMFNNGYRRMWDAGHYKFVWSK